MPRELGVVGGRSKMRLVGLAARPRRATSVSAALNCVAQGLDGEVARRPRRPGGRPCRRPRRTGRRSARMASSLAERTRPVSVAAPQRSAVIAAPSRCCRSATGRRAGRRSGPPTLRRLRKVPLVEPRSSTTARRRGKTRAWSCETKVSSRVIWHRGPADGGLVDERERLPRRSAGSTTTSAARLGRLGRALRSLRPGAGAAAGPAATGTPAPGLGRAPRPTPPAPPGRRRGTAARGGRA